MRYIVFLTHFKSTKGESKMLLFLKATVDGWRRSLLNGRGTGHSGRLTLDTRRQSLQWVLGQHIACIACASVYLYFVWSYLYLWSSICICICIWWWQSLQLVLGQHIACTCDLGSKNRYKICESVRTRIFLVLEKMLNKKCSGSWASKSPEIPVENMACINSVNLCEQ